MCNFSEFNKNKYSYEKYFTIEFFSYQNIFINNLLDTTMQTIFNSKLSKNCKYGV